MNSKNLLMALAFISGASGVQQTAAQVILTAPEDYQLMAISPNGKWACGVYQDYSYTDYAFRWNLESGSIELLSTASASIAWDIANDGTVSGNFMDTEAYASGVEVDMPGYYKDNKWHHLEMPEGVNGDGLGYSITPDGHYMSGSVMVNGKYTPCIWKDGQLYRNLGNGFHGMPYAIAPDGQAAAGWAELKKGDNRNACYWAPDDDTPIVLSKYASAFCAAFKFSPDGKKIVFWGGWDNFMPDENGEFSDYSTLSAIYDIESKTITSIPTMENNDELNVYGISNNSTVVGDNQGLAFIYTNGQGQYAEKYLEERGVSFEGLGIMQVSSRGNNYMIFRAAAISADDKAIGLLYYDEVGAMRSMVVKLDQDAQHQAPVEVAASQLSGINSVCVSWMAPYGATGVTGYNIYRGETKLNEVPVTALKYYDAGLEYGDYSYTVGTVYNDGVETKASPVSASVVRQPISTPQTLYLRQKGFNSAQLLWGTPASNLITKSYVDAETANLQGFSVTVDGLTFETAVNFDKAEMANYGGCKIKEVAFYPMGEQKAWAVNIYTRDANGTLTPIVSQPITQQLNYMERNTVRLNTPLDLPDGDLIVAIQATASGTSGSIVGMDFGNYTAGYSDLIRQSTENDFYSLYEASVANGYPYFTSWMIDVVLSPEGAADNADVVKSYNIYADGQKVAETTANSYVLPGLADGTHTIGVDAVFEQGTSATVSKDLTIATRYKAVEHLVVYPEEDTKVFAFWQAPSDDDATTLSYATGSPKTGPKGPASNNYGLMASCIYTPSLLKGYDNYRVTSLSFYPTANAVFTFWVNENDKQIMELEVDDYVLNQWNTVKLPEPLVINAKSNYTLVLDCYDVEEGMAPLAIDDTPTFTFYSDLYSLDGSSWNSLTSTGLNGNWMLGWTMTAPDEKLLDVDGYDVRIDGKKVNDTRITDCLFRYDLGTKDEARHTLNVDVYYPAVEESVKGGDVYFYLGTGATGINGSSVAVLNLRRAGNFLRAEGDNVEAITVYDMAGKKVAEVSGNTLNVSGFNTGIYAVKIKDGGKEVTRKIEIRK